MSKNLVRILAWPIALLAFLLLGPRPRLRIRALAPNLPNDLDDYLRRNESQVKGLKPGTEKRIDWLDPSERRPTAYSLVYLHGFSASPREIDPLPNLLARNLRANLFATRLEGHGQDGEALARATMNDWARDALEALEIGKRLGNKVIVLGTSTGGTLATWLAAEDKLEYIHSLILISPNFQPKDRRTSLLTLPWARYWAPWIGGRYREWVPENEEQAQVWTHRYPLRATIPLMALVQTVRRMKLERIRTPVLCFLSRRDKTVECSVSEATFERFGSSYKAKFYSEREEDPSHHVLAGRILSPGNTDWVLENALNFLRATGVNA